MDEISIKANSITGLIKRLWWILLFALVPIILIAVFGLFVKTTPEYKCALNIVEDNEQIFNILGKPIRPGLFAWLMYYERGGMESHGAYTTSVTGPKGSGDIKVGFYRTPIGSSLEIWFTINGDEMEVYNSSYPCRE
ncbi:MAG: hypothetical protein JW704_07115 [Anaerolineaceae bacterium]|nr:hypothetical protein [Anaerolineaceae bacterium]MBN2677273.1 hypothetical protein [Anaerolineaceae bacterium]